MFLQNIDLYKSHAASHPRRWHCSVMVLMCVCMRAYIRVCVCVCVCVQEMIVFYLSRKISHPNC
jgi:hypothetical protein